MSPILKCISKSIAREFIPSLFIFLCVAGVASTQAQTRSLDYYISHAIDDSPAITEQQNKATAAKLNKKIINADLKLPSVTATGNYFYAPVADHYGYDEAITDGGHYAALLNVNYPLFTGKRKDARIQASTVNIKQTEYQVKQQKHDLKRSVTDQYITTYQDILQIQYLDDIHDLLSQQKQITQSLADEGVARITDVKQLDIELQHNRISRKSAENSYQQNLLQLKVLAGIVDTATSVQLQEPTIAIENQATDQSYFRNQFKLDSLHIVAQQQVSELKYQPSVNLYGDTGLNAVKFTGIQDHFGYSAGLNVSVPIYDGGQRSITRQQSRLQQQSIDAYQQRFKINRRLHLAGLRNQLQRKGEQFDLIRTQINQYKELLKDNRKELVQGLISVTEYLTILRNYADTRQQLIQIEGEQLQLKNEYQYWNW